MASKSSAPVQITALHQRLRQRPLTLHQHKGVFLRLISSGVQYPTTTLNPSSPLTTSILLHWSPWAGPRVPPRCRSWPYDSPFTTTSSSSLHPDLLYRPDLNEPIILHSREGRCFQNSRTRHARDCPASQEIRIT